MGYTYIYYINQKMDVIDSRPEAEITHTANEILAERVEREKKLRDINKKRRRPILNKIASIFI